MKNKLIEQVKKWSDREGNGYAKLAFLLGYKSSSVIQMWIAKGEIPHYQIDHVRNIIHGEREDARY